MRNYLARSVMMTLVCSLSLAAQGVGVIDGTVLDASEAAVPGAPIVLANVATGATATASSSQEGYFTFTDLIPGQYSATVSAAGFKVWQQSNIILAVGQHVTLRPRLEIGASSEQIEVTGGAPLVTTADSTVSNVVDSKRIEDLPLNGRNALQLVSLVPGVVSTGTAGQFGATQVTFSSSGGRDIDTNYTLDGGFNMNQFYGIANEYPNPDALQEFAVTTRDYSAQFGRGTSSVSAVTRSGTNQFHGTAFWFLRNTDFDSRPLFAAARPDFKRNQYGGTFGGPIIRNKLFFFVSYQGTKERGSPGDQTYTTLTAAQRTGDFSASTKPIIDPVTNLPFPGNVIPTGRIQPQAQAFLQQFLPAANSGSDLYRFTVGNQLDQNQVVAKVDYSLSSNDRISARYFYNDVPQVAFAGGSGSAIASDWISNLPTRFQNSTVSYLHTFSPNVLNDAKVTYVRSSFGVIALKDFSLSQLGYPINTASAINSFGLTPDSELSLSGYFGAYLGAPTRDITPTWEVSDNLSWVAGIHTINLGMDLYHNRVNELQNYLAGGDFNFNGQATGDAAADFLLGNFNSYQQETGFSLRLRQTLPSFYFQDDIKVSRRLTLSGGLRWEPVTGYSSEDKQLSTFEPGKQSTLFPNATNGLLYPGDDGLPSSIVGTRWNNLAPRVGVAWDVRGDGKTSVRAGFGIYYAPFTRGISYNHFANIQPYTLRVNLFGGQTDSIFAPPPFNGVDPFPRPSGSDLAALKELPFVPTAEATALALPLKTQSDKQWSFSLQQALWKDALIELNYVGSSGSHEVTSYEGNPAIYIPGVSTVANTQERRLFPEIGGINVMAGALSSNYNAMQLSFRQRYAHGVSVQSNYTSSKALGVVGSETEGSNGTRDPFNARLDYGPLTIDRTHNFVTSIIWDTSELVRFSSPVLRTLAKGWQLTGIVTMQSGSPLTLTSGLDNSLSGIGADTPDQVSSWHLAGDRSKAQQIQEWFNPAAFVPNAIGTYGNVGIGALRNPGLWNIDGAVQRNFKIYEGSQLSFRASFYNALNHANLGNPTSNLSSPSFGQILTSGDPRVIELGLRLAF